MEIVDMENISEELLIFHCSPTMAGLKTGNLFNCSVEKYGTKRVGLHVPPEGWGSISA